MQLVKTLRLGPPGNDHVVAGLEAVAELGTLSHSRSLRPVGVEAAGELGTPSPSVTPGAQQLGVVQMPTAGVDGQAFAVMPRLQVQDGSGNPLGVAGIQVTVTLLDAAGNPAGSLGALVGATVVSSSGTGAIDFTTLAINDAAF